MIRPAATVMVLRQGEESPEVLMVRRAGSSAFMGGTYVFPGGAVDGADRELAGRLVAGADPEQAPWLGAGLRELAEEAGVLVTDPADDGAIAAACAGRHGRAVYQAVDAAGARFDGAALAYFDNWVTPEGLPRRFDTRFYVAVVPPGTPARPDLVEVTEAAWETAAGALQRGERGEWELSFPTRKHLEMLAEYREPAAAVAGARARDEVPRIVARLERRPDGSVVVVVPGDPPFAVSPGGESP